MRVWTVLRTDLRDQLYHDTSCVHNCIPRTGFRIALNDGFTSNIKCVQTSLEVMVINIIFTNTCATKVSLI